MFRPFPGDPELPQGLAMALAQNIAAMERFAGMSREQQQAIIERTHMITSHEEMEAFVNGMIH